MVLAYDQAQGRSPQGDSVAIPVAGIAATSQVPLAANASWDTGWLNYQGANSVHFAISSDAPGTYAVMYSLDGTTEALFQPGTVPYIPNVVQPFQGALQRKGRFFRFIYTNGPTAQTAFYCEINFGNAVQPTLRSLGATPADTNLAMVTSSALYAKDGNGSYALITQTGGALNVKVTNPASATVKIDQTSLDALENITVKVDQTSLDALENITVMGTVGVNNLPADPATGARQATANTSLANIDGDLGAVADAAVNNPASPGSVIALLKGILTKLIGTSSAASQSLVTALVTGNQALPANPNRKNVVILNQTSAAVGIYYGTATTARIARLNSIGMFWEMNPELYTGIITVKAESGTPILEITETT